MPGEPRSARLTQLAPDEAARWYRQALELHDQAPGGDRSERCELLIGLGEAQRQVGNPEYRQTLLDAAELAQELGDADRLCRAVLANNRGWTSQVGAVDSERVQALEAAAQALPDDDPRRARVLALLACELHYAGEPARCRALAAEAIEIARAAGDPAALAHTLVNASLGDLGARHAAGAPTADRRAGRARAAPGRPVVELPGGRQTPGQSAWRPGTARRSSPALRRCERWLPPCRSRPSAICG